MAGRTGSRARRPPPVPKARPGGAAATAPGTKDVLTDGLEEATQRVTAPGLVGAATEITELLADETEALLTGGGDTKKRDERLADTNVRLALFAREQGDDEGATRHLELAAGHPMVYGLVRARAVGGGADDLESAESLLDDLPDPEVRARELLQLAEAWLYRVADPDRAVEAARRALDVGGDAASAGELIALGLEMTDNWSEVEEHLSKAADPASLIVAAHVAFDRLGDQGRALAHLESARDLTGIHALRVTELELELAALGEDVEMVDVLRRRAAALEELAPDDPQGDAIRFLLVQALGAARIDEEEAAVFASLSERKGSFAELLARESLRMSVRDGAWSEVARLLRRERPGGPSDVAAALRCAEIVDARDKDPDQALSLWRTVAEKTPDDPQVGRSIERHLAGKPAELVAYLESRAESQPDSRLRLLRRAAAVAESQVGDVEAAVRLATEVCAASDDLSDRHDLIRLYRKQDNKAAVADALAALAAGSDDRSAGALLGAAGFLGLLTASADLAERHFRAATERVPDDLTAHVALACLYRHVGNKEQLADALEMVAECASHELSRFEALQELGDVAQELGQKDRARAALEAALELRTDEAQILRTLSALADARRDWAQAVELRQRAVDSIGPGLESAALLEEVGKLELEKRKDDEAALQAFERAFEQDATRASALRSSQDIFRRLDRNEELLGALERELATRVEDPLRRLAIHLEAAAVGEILGRDAERILEHLRHALEIEPNNAGALTSLKRLASAGGLWDEIITAFSQARETAGNVASLAEAYRKKKDWKHYAEAAHRQIALTTDNKAKVTLAVELAIAYEQKLADRDAAAKVYEQILDFDPKNRKAQTELLRLLIAAGRWRDVARAYERELDTWSADHIERQIEILLELGEIRDKRLNRASESALAYEAVLERRPGHQAALDAAEVLYRHLGRDRDLLRILKAKLGNTRGQPSPELLRQIAALEERLGDVDASIETYLAAYRLEPANRETFTSLEKLCYQHERWAEVMVLYQIAIDQVENNNLRAYRLGDLYSRRGQVQLQYLGEPGEAAASYLRVIELDPDDDNALNVLETIFSQQQDWSGLIAALEKRAGLTGDRARKLDSLRRAAVIARTRSDDEEEAVRVYRSILEIEPGDRDAIDALERFYKKAENWAELVEVLESQLEAQGSDADERSIDLLERIAKISEEGLRDEERAIRYYKRIVEADGTKKQALDALSRIFESTERWSEFVEVTRRLAKITKDRNLKALLFFKCGSVMEAKFGKEEDAIRYYDAAIKTSPACLPAVHGLRDLYLRREDWPRVIQTLELEVKLWQDDKERAGVFAQIGRIYANELGQPDRALHYYESALAVDPDCVPANKALFEQYFEAKQWDRAQPLAVALAQKAMRDGDPTARSEFYRKRGIVARMTGDMPGAAESIIIALEIQPKNLAALDALMSLAGHSPDAYDFPATFRELERIYRRRDDSSSHLARVLVAQAYDKKRDGDLDIAEQLLASALELSPTDFSIVNALVDLHMSMRNWDAAVASIEEYLGSGQPSEEQQVEALLRVVSIYGDGVMDPERALEVLLRILVIREDDPEVHYRLAQEYYLLGRFDDARNAIERVIELAAAPGQNVSPARLARYYYYLGRIIEAGGDSRGAQSQYRRAAEYDPGYGPPALALANRAVASGDQRAAETLLINAAHAAMEHGDEHSAVPLQRGLARILLAGGDRSAAIEAYRGILAVEPDGAADRFALAEIYAENDLGKAVTEVMRVLKRDLRHSPAYRLLASYYLRQGDTVRAARIFSAMEMLGYAEPTDQQEAANVRAMLQPTPLRNTLSAEMRMALLASPAMTTPFGELFAAASRELTMLFPQPYLGENLVPIQTIDDRSFIGVIADAVRLAGLEPEFYVGNNVPHGAVALAHPRPIVVVDRSLIAEAPPARRFLFGYLLEAVRGGYALILNLGIRQRRELGSLMRSLFLPEDERSGPTNEFINTMPPAAIDVLQRHEGGCQELDAEVWLEGMIATAKRAGLLACDDFNAAARMIAILSGETAALTQDGSGYGTVLCGEDLFRFYMGDEYHRLREVLAHGSGPVGGPRPG